MEKMKDSCERFALARARAMTATGQARESIGVYQEKLLHATLKFFYQPEQAYHEVPIEGTALVADALVGRQAIEIQTGGFFPLKKKLAQYIAAGQAVQVVYPLVSSQWIVWLDPKTGEASPPRKSPKRGCEADALWELYRLLPYLDSPLLTVELLLLDVQEYRLPNGVRRGRKRSLRVERYPLSLVKRVTLRELADYGVFVPDACGDGFTCKQFAAAWRMTERRARSALYFLEKRGCIQRSGKEGRQVLYRKTV